MEKDYNGWKNRQTWNVSLWINNDEGLYREALAYKEQSKKPTYRGFIKYAGLTYDRTPDNIKYLSSRVCLAELNKMIKEL